MFFSRSGIEIIPFYYLLFLLKLTCLLTTCLLVWRLWQSVHVCVCGDRRWFSVYKCFLPPASCLVDIQFHIPSAETPNEDKDWSLSLKNKNVKRDTNSVLMLLGPDWANRFQPCLSSPPGCPSVSAKVWYSHTHRNMLTNPLNHFGIIVPIVKFLRAKISK